MISKIICISGIIFIAGLILYAISLDGPEYIAIPADATTTKETREAADIQYMNRNTLTNIAINTYYLCEYESSRYYGLYSPCEIPPGIDPDTLWIGKP